jgi:hypothetical protein
MTHSAGQKGYKISASAANRDQRRYSFDAREREDESMQNESLAPETGRQSSTQGWYRNAGSEEGKRRNK